MDAQLITRDMVHLLSRDPLSFKGQNGRVLVVAGSPEFPGAAALASIAALRSGADSVILATPEKVAWTINCVSPDVMTVKLPGERLGMAHRDEIERYMFKPDCVLVGSGVADDPDSRKLMEWIARKESILKVLDAGAVGAFDAKDLRNAVLLPNRAEYGLLASSTDLESLISNGNVIVQKLPRTLIHSSSGVFENQTGNAGLTKSGTGDVLAGLTAGFLAQSKQLLQSAINATYCLGLLGDSLLSKSGGPFYLASDLAEEISRLGIILGK